MAIYRDKATQYFEAGWLPFPLPAQRKSPPPTGRTGRPSLDLVITRAMVEAEAESHAEGNIATRMPIGVIGIDVDNYADKPGAETLAALEAEFGALPPTHKVTARSDGISGIRPYRVPAGMLFVEGLPGIEILQPHHRYAVVWPSIHPDTKTAYTWYGPDGERFDGVPVVADLPELPAAWIERIRIESKDAGSYAKGDLTTEELNERYRAWASKGRPCSHVAAVTAKLDPAAGARHDTMRNAQLVILRLGEAGHPGARKALGELNQWFDAAMNGDRDVTTEWRRALAGALATIEANPTPDAEKGCQDMYPETDDFDPFDVSDPEPGGETSGQEESEDDADEGRSRDGLARFNVRNKSRAAARLRDEIGTGPLSGFFRRDGELVHTPRVGEDGYIPPRGEEDDDGPAQVRVVTPLGLKSAVELRYAVGEGRRSTTGEGDNVTVRNEWEPKLFPMESINQVHDRAREGDGTPNLRVLKGVTHTPIVRPDKSILDAPGYDDATKFLYLPEAGVTIPRVSADPTPAEVKEAFELIRDIVEEFPFVEEHHRANWFGALFTPLMRAYLKPPYPVFVIDAPAPGAGKSFLASILRTVHGGILRAGWPSDDHEFSKGVLGILMETTAPVITFDNVRGKVKSAKFEALLTSATFSDRLLGVNRNGSAPNDRLWTITANNAEIDGDLARRSYWITIDPRMPRPFERTGFRLDLNTWVPENRGRILHALLTIVQGWTKAGAPAADRKRSDDYAAWDAAMEGLLNWAGFSGQFGKADTRHLESNEDGEWRTFLEQAFEAMGDEPFKLKALVEKIGEHGEELFDNDKSIDPAVLPGDLAEKWSRSQDKSGFTKTLGLWFKYRNGRYTGDLVVKTLPNAKKGNSYQITRWNQDN